MNMPFEAVRISEHVYWVGATDWSIRDFHGYSTKRGTTYNAYLVMADKITLVDTVKLSFFDEMHSRISSIIKPEKIDYIVSNHSEMDHSGALPKALERFKPEKLFASEMGAKALEAHFGNGEFVSTVKTGDVVSLGNMNLSFVETKMLHWPDSMFTYLDSDGVLFSQDAFGMHLATCERLADENPDWILDNETAKYFANILLPFSKLVCRLIDEIPGLVPDIRVIAPDHGPVWRKRLDRIIGQYRQLAEQKPANKAIVVYDTMWGSTGKMAEAIAEGIASGESCVKILKLRSDHRSDVVAELLGAGALIVGSPTINNNMFPTISDQLTYMKGLKPVIQYGAAFGSYGWSGEAARQIGSILDEMKIQVVDPCTRSLYVPGSESLMECRNLGVSISKKIQGFDRNF